MEEKFKQGEAQGVSDRLITQCDQSTLSKAPAVTASPPAIQLPKSGNWLNNIHRSSLDVWLGGVCGGLGEATFIPSWCWRTFFLGFSLLFGIGLIPYIVLWICMPGDAKSDKLSLNDIDNISIDKLTKKALTITTWSVFSLVAVGTVAIFVVGKLSNLWSYVIVAFLLPLLLLPFFIIRVFGNKRVKLLRIRVGQLETDLVEAQHHIRELETSNEFLTKLQSPAPKSSLDESK